VELLTYIYIHFLEVSMFMQVIEFEE